nr:hypothetical protein [Lachnospiraceae bacterium]
SYTMIKKLHYGFRSVISFSNRLLFVPIYLGIVITLLSIVFIIGVFIEQFVFHHNPEGWNTLAIAIFFFGGFTLMNLGVMGAYIGNIFDVSRERPLYIIQEEKNFDSDEEEEQEDDTL